MRTRIVVWVLVAVFVAGGAASIAFPRIFASDSDGYCAYLDAQQSKLSQLWGQGDQSSLIASLPILNRAAAQAPADIQASWTNLTTAIGSLEAAIAATGHEPSEFAGGKVPPGVTLAQQQAIAAAAGTLTQTSTEVAAAKIQQQVRDVCHFNLGM